MSRGHQTAVSMATFDWTTQDYLYVIAECFAGVFSVLGNGLVLLAIARTYSLQTITNCFIGSLAAADLLVGIVLPPSVIAPYLGEPRNFYGCVLVNSLVVLITNISILSMLAVALERFLAIRDPYLYQRLMSIKLAKVVVALTWIIAILLGLIPIMGWNLGKEGFDVCAFTKVIDLKYMVYLVFFGVTLPPLFFMLIIYLYIFHIIRKQQRAVTQMTTIFDQNNKQLTVRKQKREVRGAKGLAYVIVLFAVCWMPINIMNCVTVFAPEKKASLQWHLVAIVLSHANSFINPFLYASSNTQFKKTMLQLLFCGRCQNFYAGIDPDGDSRFISTTVKRWSSFRVSDVLPSSPSQIRNFAEPTLSIRGSLGVLNEAFSSEEVDKPVHENELSVFNEAEGEGGSATHSEPVRQLPETGNDHNSRTFEDCNNHQSGHCPVDRPICVCADGCVSKPVENGPNTQAWVTDSSDTPHHHNHIVSVPKHSHSSEIPTEPPIPGRQSSTDPQPQCSNNNNNKEVLQAERDAEAKVEIRDSKLRSMQFVSVRL